MTQNKHLFIGFALVVVGILSFLGYSYYSTRESLQEAIHKHGPIVENQITNMQNHLSHTDVTIVPAITKTTPSVIDKTTIKQDYQPTEPEKLFFHLMMESLKPKPLPKLGPIISDGGIDWKRETYKAFPSREPLFPGGTEQYEGSASYSEQFYKQIIINLSELVRQSSDSPYRSFYQETFDIIAQMQKEDEDFYNKYDINKVSLSWSDIHYRGTLGNHSTVPQDERIVAYIHCLRYSYFHKLDERYVMEYGIGDGMVGFNTPCNDPILSSAKLINVGVSAAPAVLNILEDRRLIIAVDEDKIPSRFYRYQDAAVEILQRMFTKAQRPFPIEIPQGEYFSQYIENQTPTEKQRIISEIKQWVGENMKPQPPPETDNDPN